MSDFRSIDVDALSRAMIDALKNVDGLLVQEMERGIWLVDGDFDIAAVAECTIENLARELSVSKGN